MPSEYRRGQFTISTNPARLDVDAIHAYLSHSYWAKSIPKETVARSLAHSYCFGVYDEDGGGAQIGLARLVTDRATFAYFTDVYILEAYRGNGLGKWLVATVLADPEVQGLRNWCLVTRDAHGVYEQFGFAPIREPERYMVRSDFAGYPAPPASTDGAGNP